MGTKNTKSKLPDWIFAKFDCYDCVAQPNGPGGRIPGIWKCNDKTKRWDYDYDVVEANKDYFDPEDYEEIMKGKYKKGWLGEQFVKLMHFFGKDKM